MARTLETSGSSPHTRETLIEALREVRLLQVEKSRLPEVIDAVSNYSYKALGLPVAA